jgi:hypothetical protein
MTDGASQALNKETFRAALGLLEKTIRSHERIYRMMLHNLKSLISLQQNYHNSSASHVKEELKSRIAKYQQQCEAQKTYLEAVCQRRDVLIQKIHDLDSFN